MNSISKQIKTDKHFNIPAPLMIITAGIAWGIIGIFSRRLAAAGFNPVQITWLRCLITGISLLIFLALLNPSLLRIKLKDVWMFAGTGILSIAFFNISYFICMESSTLSVACTLLYTGPCFVTIMSCAFFREKFTTVKLCAIVLSLLGCAFTTGLIGSGVSSISMTAAVSGVCSGFGYALYSIIGRLALRKYNWLTVITYTFVIAAVVLTPVSGISNLASMCFSGPDIVICILLLGTVSTAAPFLLYTNGLERMETGKASLLTFTEPAVATIISAAVFHESFRLNNAVGIALIALSIIILNINKEKLGK